MLTQPYQTGLALHPEQYQAIDKIMVYFFSMFKFGHEAVVVFFVLSGFVIHLKQAGQDFKFEDFSVAHYFRKRIIRIYPTLLVSFFLCVAIDYLIYHFVAKDIGIFNKYSAKGFICNLLLIPDAPIWGDNYPVWSLKHEWFFYLLYPVMLWLSQRHTILPPIIILLFFITYIAGIRIPYIGEAAYTLLVWNIGVVLAIAYQKRKQLFSKYLPFLTFAILCYPFIDRITENYPLLDLVFGCATAGFLALVISGKIPILNRTLIKLVWLGTFSYSLYLLHMPILDFFKAYWLAHHRQLPFHLWNVLIASMVTLPIIYCIYWYTERLAINYKKNIKA